MSVTPRVLIVEDEPGLRLTLSDRLGSTGDEFGVLTLDHWEASRDLLELTYAAHGLRSDALKVL